MAYTTADSGNIFVRNYGKNPAVNFNFMLRVEGVYDLPCRSVRAFQRENEYELIQEGGLNDYVHMRRKPISKPFTFQVERYVGVDILDPLTSGTDLVLPVILFVNRYSVYGDFLPVRMYVFTGCTVMAKEYGELNAEKSGLLTETTTIAYREMACMENIAGSFLMEEPWRFHDKDKKGNGKQSARHGTTWFNTVEMDKEGNERVGRTSVNDEEPVLKDFMARAKKWSMKTGQSADGKPVSNTVPMAAVEPANQKSKKEMEAAAKKWKYTEGGKENHQPMRSVQPVNQKTKKELEKNARKWEFKADNIEPMAAAEPKGQKTREEMEAVARKWNYRVDGKENHKPMAAVEPDGQKSKEQMEGNSKKWDFKTGGTKPMAAVQPEGQKSRADMEKGAKKWEFKADNIEPMAAVEPEGQKSKSEMEGNAKRWEFKADNTEPMSAVEPEGQKSKEQMEGNAQKWEFKAGGTKPMAAVEPEGQKSKSEMEGNAKRWEFKADNTEPMAAVEPEGQKSKKQMEGNAQKWDFRTGGTKPMAAVQPEGQKSKSAMESSAKKWPPTRSAADVAAFLKKGNK